MASASEKRKVKGILHNIVDSKLSDIFTDLALKLSKTNVDKVDAKISLDVKFKDKDKMKYEGACVNVLK